MSEHKQIKKHQNKKGQKQEIELGENPLKKNKKNMPEYFYSNFKITIYQ